ncbi:MAG: hypothetical protein R3B68_12580 [Phycisphaerales bacterium]
MGCQFACPIGQLALEIGHDQKPLRTLIDLNFRNTTAHTSRAGSTGGRPPAPGTDISPVAAGSSC